MGAKARKWRFAHRSVLALATLDGNALCIHPSHPLGCEFPADSVQVFF